MSRFSSERKRFLQVILLLFCVLLILPRKGRASHAAGGEIIYEWVSGSTYRFYLKFYRDCGGIDESGTISLCYFNSCGTQSGSVRLQLMSVLPDGSLNGNEVSPGCPRYPTKCRSGNLPGFRELWYEAVFTLPSECDYWTFYSSITTRNTNSNIGVGNLYLEATLNNKDAKQHSSPWFSVKPVPYVCINSPFTFNNGAIDPDNDSLSFEFIHPRAISSSTCASAYTATNIPFSAGYSLAEPFATGNTFVFDPLTGQMSFTPTQVSANSIAVRVNKWRNGVKIGSVMRDIQVQVLNCNVPLPSLTTIPGSFSGSIFANGRVEGTANQPLAFCFDIATTQADGVLVVTDNHARVAPASSMLYNGIGSKKVLGCFSWTPSCSDTGIRLLTVTVKDSTCKPPGVSIVHSFVIPVYIRSERLVQTSRTVCAGDAVILRTAGTSPVWSALPGGSPATSLSCTQCPAPVARPEVTTTYEAVSSVNGCVHKDRITLLVDNDANDLLISPASPHILCEPDSVQLTVQVNGPAPLMNLSCGTTAVMPSTPADTVEIAPLNSAVQNAPNSGSTPFGGGFSVSSRHQYLLRASDMRASGMYPGTLTGMAFNLSSMGAGVVYDSIRISLGCTDRQAMDATAGFIPGTVPVYTSAAPVPIVSTGGYLYFDFDTYYSWDTTQNLVVDICYKNPDTTRTVNTYYFNNSYQATLYSFAGSGSACGNPAAMVYSTHELPQIRFNYRLAPAADFSYRWTGGVFYPDDTGSRATVYVRDVTHVVAHSRSRYGCDISDTLEIYFADPFTLSGDTSVCYGSSVGLLASGGNDFTWFEQGFNPPATLSCSQCADPVATPEEDMIYTVTGTNIYGCRDTLFVRVRVKPLPEVRIRSNDTLLIYGESMELQASGADLYTWTPPSGLDNPDIPNPVASPRESTVYTVTGALNGCFGQDSIRIEVDMRSRAFIPTAFSPDGDGRNDIFRVGNLRFENVQEFRVFNRWGKEVYNSNGSTAGWDGTCNGEAQPSGVYQYMVRIAYPDGTAKLYKGDVTLLR